MFSLFRSLDLSFNRIKKVECLDTLVNLKKLFFIHNKVSVLNNINHLVNLEMLEFGSNRIRVGTSTCNTRNTLYIKEKCQLV